LHRPIRRQ